MGKIKVNRQSLLYFMIYIFLLINLFRDLLPGGTNQLIGGVVIILIIINLLPLKTKEMMIYFFYFFSAGIAVFSSDDISNHIKYFIYFLLNITVFMFLTKGKQKESFYNVIVKKKVFLRTVILLFTIIIGVMLLANQCYSTDLWNGGRYFQGFSVPHGVAGNCCLAISTVTLLFSIDKKYKYIYVISILFFLIAIIKAGTRTYLISSLALLLLSSISLIENKKNRRFLIVIGVVSFVFIVFNSESFQKKIEYSMSFQNLLGWNLLDAFTSSRTIIWSNDIRFFFEKSNLVQLLFGGGFSYSYEINSGWTYRIQAHNGFIEVLMSTGIVGFILYLKLLINYMRSLPKNRMNTLIILLYVPAVIFWDDILQAPSYMMSFIILFCEMHYLETLKYVNTRNLKPIVGEVMNDKINNNNNML